MKNIIPKSGALKKVAPKLPVKAVADTTAEDLQMAYECLAWMVKFSGDADLEFARRGLNAFLRLVNKHYPDIKFQKYVG